MIDERAMRGELGDFLYEYMKVLSFCLALDQYHFKISGKCVFIPCPDPVLINRPRIVRPGLDALVLTGIYRYIPYLNVFQMDQYDLFLSV